MQTTIQILANHVTLWAEKAHPSAQVLTDSKEEIAWKTAQS